MEIPIIETKRLRLRGWKQSDKESFAELNSNEEFMTYLGSGKPLNKIDSWKVMAMLAGHWALKGFGFWLVEDKNTNELIGRVGIWEPEGWPAIEVGWGIHPSHWGKGFATEAGYASIDWAFNNLSLSSLISVIHPDNIASKAVALKLEEIYSHDEKVLGEEHNIFKITKEEFLKGK